MVTDQWKRLQDATANIDIAQAKWVMDQEVVRSSYESMMTAFNHYLFEKFKDEFAGLSLYQDIVNKYVDSILTTAANYAKHTANLEKENEELKQKLQELMNANGHKTS